MSEAGGSTTNPNFSPASLVLGEPTQNAQEFNLARIANALERIATALESQGYGDDFYKNLDLTKDLDEHE